MPSEIHFERSGGPLHQEGDPGKVVTWKTFTAQIVLTEQEYTGMGTNGSIPITLDLEHGNTNDADFSSIGIRTRFSNERSYNVSDKLTFDIKQADVFTGDIGGGEKIYIASLIVRVNITPDDDANDDLFETFKLRVVDVNGTDTTGMQGSSTSATIIDDDSIQATTSAVTNAITNVFTGIGGSQHGGQSGNGSTTSSGPVLDLGDDDDDEDDDHDGGTEDSGDDESGSEGPGNDAGSAEEPGGDSEDSGQAAGNDEAESAGEDASETGATTLGSQPRNLEVLPDQFEFDADGNVTLERGSNIELIPIPDRLIEETSSYDDLANVPEFDTNDTYIFKPAGPIDASDFDAASNLSSFAAPEENSTRPVEVLDHEPFVFDDELLVSPIPAFDTYDILG